MGFGNDGPGAGYAPTVNDAPPPPPPPPYPQQQQYSDTQGADAEYNMYPYPPAMYVPPPPPPTDEPMKPAPAPHSHLDVVPGADADGPSSPMDALNAAPSVAFFFIGLVVTFLIGPFALCLLCIPPFGGGNNPRATKWFLGGFAASIVLAIVIGVIFGLFLFSAKSNITDAISSLPQQ